MKSRYTDTLPASSVLVVTFLLLACCALFVSLGVWQLSRADEKRAIEVELQSSLTAAAEEWHLHSPAFTRVRARGRFDPEIVFFIDNRIHLGEAGVQVVQVFAAESGSRLLVDRGWAAHPDRQIAPEPLAAPTAQVEIIGLLLPDFGTGPQWDSAPLVTEAPWPKRLQQLDLALMGRLAGVEHGNILKLRGGEPGALVTQPFALPLGADRHLGYAVQWFALALASITILALFARKSFRMRAQKRG